MLPLAINWPLSSVTGYGLYGLQILMHYLRRGGREFILTDYLIPPITLPAPFDTELTPLLEQACEAARVLDRNPGEILRFNHPVLHGVGNSFSLFKNQLRVKGNPNVGCAAIEEPICPPAWRPFLAVYDLLIAPSRWNERFLSSLNLAPVHLCHLGVDTTHFYPTASSRTFEGRFAIFSGGKFEFRKAQDVVVAAFKRFHARHPDALLVTSWQNRHLADPSLFAAIGHCQTTPQFTAAGTELALNEWLLQQGLPHHSFVVLPWTPNAALADIMRSCNIAIFPNRCEGGTNLVAKETIACGVPTYVASNTGQQDLIDLVGCGAFVNQTPIQSVSGMASVEGWCESDIDEIVETLENVYTRTSESKKQALAAAERMKSWSWDQQNERLLKVIFKDLDSKTEL